jgi:hypothetical protein
MEKFKLNSLQSNAEYLIDVEISWKVRNIWRELIFHRCNIHSPVNNSSPLQFHSIMSVHKM